METYIVDSFTDKPFQGNPAGVCILNQSLTDQQMLCIAQELGLSETAFIDHTDRHDSYSIQYFSPVMEIPLCGHATLAASKVLFERNADLKTLHFKTRQQLVLTSTKREDSIAMEFPIYDTFPQEAPYKMLQALGVETIVNSAFNKENNILLIEIESSKTLKNLAPDFEKLKASHHSINGVLITATSQRDGFDFESRYFWPWSGTNEDPVTGGTHTFLAKYWSVRLNKKKMNSFQCSKRTGFMEVALISEHKLLITSKAQIILKGTLRI